MVRNKLSAGVSPAVNSSEQCSETLLGKDSSSPQKTKFSTPLSVFRTGNYTKLGASINTKSLDLSSKWKTSPRKKLFNNNLIEANGFSPHKKLSKFQNGGDLALSSHFLNHDDVNYSTSHKGGVDNCSHLISRMKAEPSVYRKMFGVFQNGNEVLARWSDGLYYLGFVTKVDDLKHRCGVQFEDKSVSSVHFKDLQLLTNKEDSDGRSGDDDDDDDVSDVTCMLCRDGASEPPNEIVLCDKCGQGYHQLCHAPLISTSVLNEDMPWQCRTCVFAAVARPGGAETEGFAAAAMRAMKLALPYDINSLTWWKTHKVNSEEVYCYCGGPGDWYLKMLQCCRCQQWFHEACIQCLETPILYGDRFYIFVCAICNHGDEYVKRLPMRWVDVVHLVLYNITITKTVKYYDFLSVIIPFFAQNWESLQLGELVHEAPTRSQLKDRVLETLQNNKTRFQCGSESKKGKMSWGLRTRSPPSPPAIALPSGVTINDETLESLDLRHGSILLSDSPTPLKRNAPRDEELLLPNKKFRDSTEEWISSNDHSGSLRADNIFERMSYKSHVGSSKWSECLSSTDEVPKRKRGRPRKDQAICSKPSMSRGRRPVFGPPKLEKSYQQTLLNNEASSLLPVADPLQENGSSVATTVSENTSIFGREVSEEELRRTVASCYSAEGRIACGERYRVLGKRIVPTACGSRVEYLIEWEGFTAQQLHESVHGR